MLYGAAVALDAVCGFPDASHLERAAVHGKLQSCTGAVDAQLGSRNGVEPDVGHRSRLVVVGMHPFEFGDGTHFRP